MRLQARHPLPPYPDFATASREVVRFLNERVPLALWSVNRADAETMLILHPTPDNSYGVKAGDSTLFRETLCARMVAGEAPNIAPDVDAIPAYRDLAIRQLAPVNTYVSFPLQSSDGGLFGTLCGFDPQRSSAQLLDQQPLIELLSRQLSTILQFDLEREQARRHAVVIEARAMTDALTGIGNRHAFALYCEREEARCREIGQSLAVLVFDLDGLKQVNDRQGHAAGDRLLQQAAALLQASLPRDAFLARTGGDEFIALWPGASAADVQVTAEQVREQLSRGGISVSVGVAARRPHRGLDEALQRADAAMYADKSQRKQPN